MKKYVIVFISIIFSLVLLSPIYVNAAYIGDLLYFEASGPSSGYIGTYGNSTPSVSATSLNSNYITAATMATRAGQSVNAWNAGGIPCSYTSLFSTADIQIVAGLHNNLYVYGFNGLDSLDYGCTIHYDTTTADYYLDGTNRKYSVIHDRDLCAINLSILYVDGNNLRSTVSHELGHALGYRGHSTRTSDVMHSRSTASIYPSYYDLRHLSQIH